MHNIEILVVEDRPDFSDVLKRRLEKEAPHFSIHVVDSAEDCLGHVKGNKTQCILSDYHLEGMDGMELLKALRASGNDIPFIMLTGQGGETLAREAFKSGAYDYFTKEDCFDQIPRIINSVEQAVNQNQMERMVRKAELSLIEEKNKLDAVMAGIGEAISIQDTDFKVLYQNPAHRKLVGGHIGEYCFKSYVQKETVCDDCHLARCFEDGMVHTSLRTRETDGGMEYLEIMGSPVTDASGKIIAGIESIRNITKRKEAEQERERFLKGVSASRDGIALNDKEDRYIFVNEAYAGIFGYSPSELAGKSWKDITPGELIPKGEEFMDNVLHNKDIGQFNAEFPGIRKDGTIIPTDVTATALWDNEGNYNGHVCIVRDITEKKKLEKDRADFYAMVTHDIKSPMTVIASYAEMLSSLDACTNEEGVKGMIDAIRRSSGKVMNLIEDFLTVSKMESGNLYTNLSPLDLAALLAELRDEFRPAIEDKDLGIVFDVPEKLPLALLDRRLVHRAVSNLLQNAVSYTPHGGEISLAAGPANEEGKDCVFVSVTDNGPGISTDEQSRVFDTYYRSQATAYVKGTGLGLAIVNAVAQAHGGRVELDSEPGKGSSFRLILPVIPEL